MNTVIVPVDFSTAALHTARYAAQLLEGHHGVKLLLYHGYSRNAEEAPAIENLEALKKEILSNFIVNVDVLAYKTEEFVDGLERVVRHRKADLVVMGFVGKSGFAQALIGSNTLKMVESKVCPILIVPENVSYNEIKNVMLTSDFKETVKTTPSAPIKDFLGVFNPKLHIVNVDKNHYISLTENYENEKQHLAKMFADYNPEFYFMRLYDVNEALNLFAKDQNIDLIILIRRDESFIERLFKTSTTKAIAYQSKVPILVMHE